MNTRVQTKTAPNFRGWVISALVGCLILALSACSQNGAPERTNLETQAPNLIQNGGFDGTDNWFFWAGSPMTGKFITEDGMGKLNIQNSDGTGWKAQIRQGVEVKKGTRYTLSFKAKGTTNRPLQVVIRDASSYTNYWSKTLDLSTSTKSFSYTFTASSSNKQELAFYAGQSSKDVFLDDVALHSGDGTPPEEDNPPGDGGDSSGSKLAPSQDEANKLNDEMYDKFKASLSSGTVPQKAEQFDYGIVSEGVGYGMLLSVFNNDQATFDRFWDFAKPRLYDYDGDGTGDLLPWKFDSNGNVENSGNASDADIDIAYALLVADKKGWGGGYGDDAKKHIANLLEWNVSSNNVMQEGRWSSNDESVVNTSYQTPAFFKAFADYTGEDRWLKVRDNSYEILKNGFDRGYKVIPHDMNVDGSLNGAQYQVYDSDAARGPWRLAADYLWYGDSRAKDLLEEYNNFFESEGFGDLCDVYDTSGNATGGWCGSQAGWMIGGAACAQLADGNNKGEAWTALSNAYDGGYYSRELKALAVKMCSGYMSNPAR